MKNIMLILMEMIINMTLRDSRWNKRGFIFFFKRPRLILATGKQKAKRWGRVDGGEARLGSNWLEKNPNPPLPCLPPGSSKQSMTTQ